MHKVTFKFVGWFIPEHLACIAFILFYQACVAMKQIATNTCPCPVKPFIKYLSEQHKLTLDQDRYLNRVPGWLSECRALYIVYVLSHVLTVSMKFSWI